MICLNGFWLHVAINAGVVSVAGNGLTRKIMTLHGNLDDLLFVCKSVFEEGKKNGVKAPVFYKNYENVLSKLS